MEIVQEYKTDGDLDKYGYNLFLNENLCEIGIHLTSLMDRKNMSVKKWVKKIDSVFLLEYICAFLDSEGFWSKKLCGDDTCNIRKTLEKVNYFLW